MMAFPGRGRAFRAPSSSRFVRKWGGRATRCAVALAALALGSAALAQDDLPARVGRVADLAGAVSIATSAQADQWEIATLNRTVTTGDNLFVAPEGRAEVDYGGGQFRIAGDTNLHVVRLDERAIGLFVAQGSLVLRVRVLEPEDAAFVETPNAQVRILRPGLYRVDVRADPPSTLLSVREGDAEAYLPSGTERIPAGYLANVVGIDNPRADVRAGAYGDDFDAWSASRDAHYAASRSAAYVSRQMIGYADLDGYGAWQQYPDYGAVWFPSDVPADWAPYRYGRWSSVAGFGWTWVDDAPWGYAPFHYGRWAYIGGRWGWCPGAWVARPAWSPAMVAWYGGPSWSFTVGGGGPLYGWVPLAWGEPYLPGWSNCSHRCWTAYNRPYAVRYTERPAVLPSRYVNQVAPRGFTAVSREALASGQRISRSIVAVPPGVAAPVLRSAPIDVRPVPARIPDASRAGARGSPPPPASTMFPTNRPNRVVAPSTIPEASPVRRPDSSPPAPAAPTLRSGAPGAVSGAEGTRRSPGPAAGTAASPAATIDAPRSPSRAPTGAVPGSGGRPASPPAGPSVIGTLPPPAAGSPVSPPAGSSPPAVRRSQGTTTGQPYPAPGTPPGVPASRAPRPSASPGVVPAPAPAGAPAAPPTRGGPAATSPGPAPAGHAPAPAPAHASPPATTPTTRPSRAPAPAPETPAPQTR